MRGGVILAFLAGGSLAGQQQNQAERDVFRVSVNLVQLEVVATDAKGRHVTDLRGQDFEVLDDGKLQSVSYCSYIPLGAPERSLPMASRHQRAAPIPVRELTRGEVRRTIVLLVDDESLSPDVVPAVRSSLRAVIERRLQPGDLVALVRTSSGGGALDQFTSDRSLLLKAVDAIRWRPERPMRSLNALSDILTTLRDLPGKKAIFFLSQIFVGYEFQLDRPRWGIPVATILGRLVDQALRAGVTIYDIDPGGLSTLSPGADYDVMSEYTRQFGARPPDRLPVAEMVRDYTSGALFRLEMNRSGLRLLADGTGGFMVADTNDIAHGLGRFIDDLSGFYLLAYKPADPERYFAHRNGSPPPFHRIRVRVRQRGIHVRYHAGYQGVEEARTSDASAAPDALKMALSSPFSASGIHIRLTSVFTVPGTGAPSLQLLLHIDADDLALALENDGLYRAKFDIVTRILDEQGTADVVAKTAAIALRQNRSLEAKRMGLLYQVSAPVRHAGTYAVSVAIRDTASGALGSARGYVDVPDLKKARLALSGILVYRQNQRALDPAAPGLAAFRVFRLEDTLGYSCQVFGHDPPTIEIRVLREGKLVSAMPATSPERMVGPDAAAPRTLNGSIPLASLEPGNYVLQIVASAESGGRKPLAASQWTDFEIISR